jgi:hypothetical protein
MNYFGNCALMNYGMLKMVGKAKKEKKKKE